MCTVTYIPTNNGFLLTSNRDEKLSRSIAIQPAKYTLNGLQLIFPKDPDAGGTWIALKEDGDAFCLLNGAFETYVHGAQFTQSRGEVVLAIAASEEPIHAFKQKNLSRCAPFTLVVIRAGILYELRWDGLQQYFARLDENQPHIWSSATLYTKVQQKLREQWFAEWLIGKQSFNSYDLFHFHQFAGDGDSATNLLMCRSNVYKTVSVTCIQTGQESYSLEHLDLCNNQSYIVGFQNQPSLV